MALVIIQQPGPIRLLREYFVYHTSRPRWPDCRNDHLIAQTYAAEIKGRYHLFAVDCGAFSTSKFGELLANPPGAEEATKRLHAKALELAHQHNQKTVELMEMPELRQEVRDLTLLGSIP